MGALRCAVSALLIILGLSAASTARAEISPQCADLRQEILNLEAQIPSGAAFTVDVELRSYYAKSCLKQPGPAPSDPWFTADGAPASGPPPSGNGVFQTTPEIATYCADTSNPTLCAIMLNLGLGEIKDADGEWNAPVRDVDPADELPPLTIMLGGQEYQFSAQCLRGLQSILLPARQGGLRNTFSSRDEDCPDVARIKPRIGQVQQAMRSFGRLPANAGGAAGGLQPEFREMCDQAWTNENICKRDQAGMVTAGGTPSSPRTKLTTALNGGPGFSGDANGQAGAFGDCAAVYDSVVRMCRQSGWQEPADDASAGLPVPPAPPAACRLQVNAYIAAAQARDTQGAIAAYTALSAEPACANLLAQVAAQAGMPLPQRKMGTLTNQYFGGGCNPSCGATAPPSYEDGAGGGGDNGSGGFDIGQLLGLGLALAGQMNGLAGEMHGLAGQVHGLPGTSFRGSDMNSLAQPPVRSTYGQGAPLGPPQSTPQSTITGIGR